ASAQEASLPAQMPAVTAHAKALAGELVLIDIRTPEEWRETGVPASGHAIAMNQRRATFLSAIDGVTGGDKRRPIALICATGGRSAALKTELTRAGYMSVIDVSEGMLGSRGQPGWIKAGLPVRRWTPGATAPTATGR
ncbi:MAG: hypothetical protein RL291_974, partial [Pseudomonadota bacterium]